MIYIIDTKYSYNRSGDEWKLIYPYLKNDILVKGNDCKLIHIPCNCYSYNHIDALKHHSKILELTLNELDNIKSGDILVYTDARQGVSQIINDYLKLNNKKVFSIGIWMDGMFNNGYYNDQYKSVVKFKFNNLQYEKSIAKQFDKNLLTVETHLHKFNNWVSKNCEMINLPFSYLKNAYSDLILSKNNDILYDSNSLSLKNPRIAQIFNTIESDLKVYRFIDLCKLGGNYDKITKELLTDSKFIIDLHRININPYFIYNSVLLGCIPIVTTSDIIKLYGLTELVLDPKFIQKQFLFYIRELNDLKFKLNNMLENYNDILKSILNKLQPHYEKTSFLNLIDSICIQ